MKPGTGVDGLPPGEGRFLACSFWLADNYILMGRRKEATAAVRQLQRLANDVGFYAEEYDPTQAHAGQFPPGLFPCRLDQYRDQPDDPDRKKKKRISRRAAAKRILCIDVGASGLKAARDLAARKVSRQSGCG
jgi:hypothetical protein